MQPERLPGDGAVGAVPVVVIARFRPSCVTIYICTLFNAIHHTAKAQVMVAGCSGSFFKCLRHAADRSTAGTACRISQQV